MPAWRQNTGKSTISLGQVRNRGVNKYDFEYHQYQSVVSSYFSEKIIAAGNDDALISKYQRLSIGMTTTRGLKYEDASKLLDIIIDAYPIYCQESEGTHLFHFLNVRREILRYDLYEVENAANKVAKIVRFSYSNHCQKNIVIQITAT